VDDTSKDIITGIHSITEALKNEKRKNRVLFCTKDALTKLKPKVGRTEDYAKIEILNTGELQTRAQQIFKEHQFHYSRISSGMFLVTDPLMYKSSAFLYDLIEQGAKKFLVLDQVTDAHNAGAIFRTAAFYGVDAIIHSVKGSFGRSPGFFKIASGAAEHVHSVSVPKLGQCILKLVEKNVFCVGITEDGKSEVSFPDGPICLIMGAEETGISFNVKRILDSKMRLDAIGEIETLNVSIASAIAMEKLMGTK